MPRVSPPVDRRTPEAIAARLAELTAELTAGAWTPPPAGEADAGSALVRVAARFAEIVGERLDRLPEKNFLVFLELIGARLGTPRPARVPLTFELTAGSPVDALVPAGTRVAARPLDGEEEPPVFETEDDLLVTRSRLVALLGRDPRNDLARDATAWALAPRAGGVSFPIFRGDRLIDHHLFLSHELLALAVEKTLTLRFTGDALDWLDDLAWSAWDGDDWRPLPSAVTTIGGNVRQVLLRPVPEVPASRLGERSGHWLRGRLRRALTDFADLPRMDDAELTVRVRRPCDLVPDRGLYNRNELDVSKTFAPFGQRPVPGDTLYLASDEAFSKPGARVQLWIVMSTQTGPGGWGVLPNPTPDVILRWEFWNGRQWHFLGDSWRRGGASPTPSPYGFHDETRAFFWHGRVSFDCPDDITPVLIGGEERHWIRVRIERGGYGYAAHTVPVFDDEGEIVTLPGTDIPVEQAVPDSVRPPFIQWLALGYELERGPLAPEHLLSENDFDVAEHAPGLPLVPFRRAPGRRPTLYLAFERDGDEVGFAVERPTRLYFAVPQELPAGAVERLAEPPAVVWEYGAGGLWKRLPVVDDTRGFTRRGLVSFVAPPDFFAAERFGRRAFWLRVRWEGGTYGVEPRLERVLSNTMWALEGLTLHDEVLGSGTGEPGQTVRALHPPILAGQVLEAREEGAEAEPWQEVGDFAASAPDSRHYVLERHSGTIFFGDGRHGRVPPRGRGNLRLRVYRTGGGPRGNRPAGHVSEPRDAVAYIDRVTQHEPATGGAPAPGLDELCERAPRVLRHRGRAVTAADFEDLAHEAAPQIARVRCLTAPGGAAPGGVGLILVPRSELPRPAPQRELLTRVREHLEARMTPTADLWLAGPDWLEVSVDAEIVAERAAQAVHEAVARRLTAWLHPLTGGPRGEGWPFGVAPRRSDVYALIEAVAGVDHVRRLGLATVAPSGEARAGRFLVVSGEHRILPTLEDTP